MLRVHEADQAGGKVRGDDDGRIGLTGFYVVDSSLPRGEVPAQVVIVFNLGGYLSAGVDLAGSGGGGALIFINDGDAQVGGVGVGVPETGDIEPGVHRRQETHTHHHDHSERHSQNAPNISPENFESYPQSHVTFQLDHASAAHVSGESSQLTRLQV